VRCDGDEDCKSEIFFVCHCSRCSRETEDEETFHTCVYHRGSADTKHLRTRERRAEWRVHL
jgi:hypothetical protein